LIGALLAALTGCSGVKTGDAELDACIKPVASPDARTWQQKIKDSQAEDACMADVRKRREGQSGSGDCVRPSKGTLGSPWGDPRPGGRSHEGQDFVAPLGSPIFAAKAGKVVFAGYTDPGGYGTLIEEVLPDGTALYYGHPLPGSWVFPGQVRKGQQIGKVGATGDSSGPHLHFEVRPGGVDGRRINPVPWLRRCGGL
jgi:murein DD-endopeptidase MepM/ murein hydrolase activator NlpD